MSTSFVGDTLKGNVDSMRSPRGQRPKSSGLSSVKETSVKLPQRAATEGARKTSAVSNVI